jgi:RNA polymerase sigma-70 factor (ECF subfamily)
VTRWRSAKPSSPACPNSLRPIRPEPDDQSLVRAAQRGDRTALDALLRRHHDRIHAVCRRLAGNEADALDATQEALIAIARGLRRFDGRAAFTTWAYRVATNACLDELRRRRRRPTPGLPDDLGQGEVATSSAVALDVIPERLAIDGALAELPEDFRAAVVLRDLCDLDYAEIADVLEIPPGTVRSRIARGRALLARHLAAGNQAPEPARPTHVDPTAP